MASPAAASPAAGLGLGCRWPGSWQQGPSSRKPHVCRWELGRGGVWVVRGSQPMKLGLVSKHHQRGQQPPGRLSTLFCDINTRLAPPPAALTLLCR